MNPASHVKVASITLIPLTFTYIATMLPRPRIQPSRLHNLLKQHVPPRRTIVAAPRPGSGPLMERRGDRALPTLSTGIPRWLKTLPLFAFIMVGSALAIFNYQKQSSSVVSSTLYALRTNAEAREILGDEIYFNSKVPIIWGELNQLHGRIDIQFWVKGTRGKGLMTFKSERRTRMGFFETTEWTLHPAGGRVISLLEAEKKDPFIQETADKITVAT
ncbi:cytochrome oxidase assembly protein 1 [Recurvomyces mirabilis]|uniref:Cytochrome oxidase assembly protein 1 n=1 Tax=Recurvomyces mirabilis TaxID=574656 RepID=A0AAE0TR83_9PEZI|nr:cytochrome oxidase assembly protein 1 [Recurvomyces mirabilis]KAK5156584.1 cytochrome oxidase assembly protein 1 [Recurvomyces mirabilis]